MYKPKRGKYCAAAWCSNFSGCRIDSPISLFQFPKDIGLRVEWIKFSLREDLLSIPMDRFPQVVLCSDHFAESDFTTLKPRRLLRKFACPSLIEGTSPKHGIGAGGSMDGASTSRGTCSPLPQIPEEDCNTSLCPMDISSGQNDGNDAFIQLNLSLGTERKRTLSVSPVETQSSSTSCGTCSPLPRIPDGVLGDPQENPMRILTPDQKQGCDENGEEPEETPPNEHNVVEEVKASLCRVCGRPGDYLIPIFEEARMISLQGVPLVKVLEMYLPLQISVDDSFPLNICSKCHDTLNEWHQFYVTCAAANETFKNLFGGGKEKDANCSSLCSNSITEDAAVLPPRNDHTYVKDELKETEKMQQDGESKDGIGAYDSDGWPMEDSGKIQSSVMLYFCKYCRESHNNRIQLRSHSRLCKEEPTLCEKCGKTIRHRKLMTAHMYKHQNIVRICDKCGESIHSTHFSTHCNTFHSGSYYCNLCCTILCSRTLYLGHLRRHRKGLIKSSFKIDPFRNDEGVDVYRCPVCEKLFKDLPSVIMHLNERKVLRCSTCGLKLNSEKRFAIHNCRKWDCQYCKKTFFVRDRLMEHIRIHTGEKPFKCHFCSASFRKKQQRLIHHKTHRAPSHECKYCSKKFKLATSLRHHINAHEGVFFSCPCCDKKFPGPRYLQRHIKTHYS